MKCAEAPRSSLSEIMQSSKKSLKIPKGQSEFVITDNTMVKRKSTKEQITIYKTLYIKLKDRETRTPVKPGREFMCFGRISSFCSTSGTRRVVHV
jgi:hypothetical protein